MNFIAVDAGKHSTKSLTYRADGTERFGSFRTKMEETQREAAEGNSFIVKYHGKQYLVGNQAETGSSKTTKAEELHRITTYTALHQLADSEENIIVAVGCPLAIYENAQQKKAYQEYLFPSRDIDIAVNNLTKHLHIQSIVVLPEGSGILYTDKEKYGTGTVGIIDIGGLNVNCCVYDNGMPILSTLFTDNMGGNVFLQNLRNTLVKQFGEDIPMWQMDNIVKNGYMVDNFSSDGIWPGSRKLIAAQKKEHVQKIIQKCSANGWNLRTTKLVFVGGTSGMLYEEIKECFAGADIVEEPEKANVRGFLNLITGR